METVCERCGKTFDSDEWTIDLCQDCEMELSEFENDEGNDYVTDNADDYSYDD